MRRRRSHLRTLLVIPAVLATAVLAGCFSIIGQSTRQDGEIGDLVVTTDLCLSGVTGGCGPGLSQTVDGDVQYLLGYLLPTWAIEPASVAFTGAAGDQTLNRNVAYESILQGFAPAPLGLKWIGFASERRPAPPVGVDQRMQATARVGVPPATPNALPLATVSGWRTIRDPTPGKATLPIDRAFNCEEVTDAARTTVCILSGEPQQATTPGQTPTATDIPINTLTIGSPAPPAGIRAGATATIRFPVTTNYSGTGNDTIPMKVTTTLRGATIESPPNLILGQTPRTAEVRITAPISAQTGDYAVTFSTANELRSATTQVRVTSIRSLIAPTDAASVSNLNDAAVKLRAYLRTARSSEIRRANTFDLPVSLPAAGTLQGTLTAKGSRTILSTGKKTARLAGAVNLALKPTATGRRILRSGRALRGRLTLRFTPRSGKRQTATLTVNLR